MYSSNFKSSFSVTHVGTATAVLEIDDVKILTDPFFSPAETTWDFGGIELSNTEAPAIGLDKLPPFDAVLLSHEDHPDNLDEVGRRLLDGRHVFTTMDGAQKLAPRPGVCGMKPWEGTSVNLGGKTFEITATPYKHVPGGECIGFVLTTESFGVAESGKPNAIYFTGDTVYIDELAEIPKQFNVAAVVMNLGKATVDLADGPLQVTMDGKQGAQLLRTLKTDCLVPMHYESWRHFAQLGKGLAKDFEQEGISDRIHWLTPGKSVKIL